MNNLNGDRLMRYILAFNGTVFLIIGIFGMFYHYLIAVSCILMATILYISPVRSLTSKHKFFVYLYYLLFPTIFLLILLTFAGILNTYA